MPSPSLVRRKMLSYESVLKKIDSQVRGKVLSAHTEDEHFYRLSDSSMVASVTTKMIVEKPLLRDYYARKAIEYFVKDAKYRLLTEQNIEMHTQAALQQPTKEKDDAAAVGTAVHNIIDQYLKHQNPGSIEDFIPKVPVADIFTNRNNDLVDGRIVSACLAAEKAIKESPVKVLTSEINVGSISLGTAGQVDAIMWNEETQQVEIWDWKTSNYVFPTHSMQLAAYAFMFTEMCGVPISAAYVVHIDKEKARYKKYQVADMERSLEMFRAIASIYDWEQDPEPKLIDTTKKVIKMEL